MLHVSFCRRLFNFHNFQRIYNPVAARFLVISSRRMTDSPGPSSPGASPKAAQSADGGGEAAAIDPYAYLERKEFTSEKYKIVLRNIKKFPGYRVGWLASLHEVSAVSS